MYIGAKPNVANYTMLDSITTSATTTFNLTKDGVAFFPENPLGVICSLNGVIQKAGSSFNIVNSTIVFSSTLASTDVIDFILVMAQKIDLNTPADSSVTNAKTNFVSSSSSAGLQIKGDGTTDGTLQLNCSQNSHGIKLKSPPHSAGASYTLTFPTTDGNADEFLQTDGSGTLTWAEAGGGSMTKLQTQTASSSSSITFTSTYLTSTYKVYQLHCTAIDLSNDGGNLGIQTSTDNGSSYTTTGYKNIRIFNRDDTSTHAINSGHGTSDDRVRIVGTGYGVGTNNNEGGMSIVTIFDPSGTGKGKFFKCYGCHFDENNKLAMQDHTFALDQSTAINNFKIVSASGTFSGTFTLYGIA